MKSHWIMIIIQIQTQNGGEAEKEVKPISGSEYQRFYGRSVIFSLIENQFHLQLNTYDEEV